MMNHKNKINFQEIAEQIDTLIELVDNKKMVNDYPTTALLNLVETEFDVVTKALDPLRDMKPYKDM